MADWAEGVTIAFTRTLGDEWAESGGSLVLVVPSAEVSQEANLLLNPRHPRFGEVRVVTREPHELDPRLLGGWG